MKIQNKNSFYPVEKIIEKLLSAVNFVKCENFEIL